MAILFKWNIDKIYIYPYGGCTKFQDCLNKPLYQELLILLNGPLFQIAFFLIVKKFLSINDLSIFKDYNYAILFFNILPIYPLDGGKLLNIVFSYFCSYKNSFIFSIYISCIFVIILIFYKNNLTFYLVVFLLIIKLIEEYKKRNYYFNKFLLERYLYKFKYKKIKVIDNIYYMMRDKKHVIRHNDKYVTEYDALKDKYSVK